MSTSTNTAKIMKKAAMFGLDARIALAIFGALSVISGAVLYNAIQDADATVRIAKMQEVAKTYEQYYLDTGQDLPRYDESSITNINHRVTSDLVSSSVNGWKGPYLSYSIASNTSFLKEPGAGNISIISTSINPWGEGHANQYWSSSGSRCSTSIQCYLWVQFSSTSKSHLARMDEKIDGGDGAYSGNFRWYLINGNYTYMLKFMPVDY